MVDGTQQEWLEQAQAMGKLWMEAVSRMSGAALAFSPGSTPPEAARQVRDAFLSSLDHSFELYMRSEPFLKSMRQSLDLAMELRKQFSQYMNHVQHAAGAVAEEDIRSLMLGIRHAEERFARRMDQLNTRLDQIDSRLDEMQEQLASSIERAESGSTSEEEDESGSAPSKGALPKRKRRPRRPKGEEEQ